MTPSDKYDITELLATKTFEELTADERQYALTELGSAHEYREMYAVVNGAQQLDEAAPSNTLRNNIMDAFDQVHSEEKKIIPFYIQNKNKIIAMLASAAVLTIVFIAGMDRVNKQNNQLAEATTRNEIKTKDTTHTASKGTAMEELSETNVEQKSEPPIESLEKELEEITPIEESPAPAQIAAIEETTMEDEDSYMDDALEYEILDDLASVQMESEETLDEEAESKDAISYADSAPTKQEAATAVRPTSASAISAEGVNSRSLKKSIRNQPNKVFTLKVVIPSSTHYTSY